MAKKVTQKQCAFYTLYRSFRTDRNRFVPTFEFVGEIKIFELDMWVLRTYKCPTRLTDIYQENPRLLERSLITGNSGSKYYGYRFAQGVCREYIDDPTLLEFYDNLKTARS